jgi:glutamate dehydrogenase/leucine dehydrogenase
MSQAFQRVEATAKQEGADLRTAALMLALKRLAEGQRLRGLYP